MIFPNQNDSSHRAWNLMVDASASYQGQGKNHEGETYTGTLKLELALPKRLISVHSTATSESGEVFHQELSWIGRDLSGALTLFVTSNNHPAVTPHLFHRYEETDDAHRVVFRFGVPEDRASFREEVTFSFFKNGDVAHLYAWALPGGDFAPRSGSRMQRRPPTAAEPPGPTGTKSMAAQLLSLSAAADERLNNNDA